jgi:S-adenosylmethionine hydrolase
MAQPFSPCGVITLTTDFGHKGPFVASMKGVVLTRFPNARIVDLTHEIIAHWPAEAGFWLERAYPYFPDGTVHMAVVDPGVGTSREIIAVQVGGHVFLAPDNGLLALLIDQATAPVLHKVDMARLRELGVKEVSATFHGRDVFAPLAAALASGQLRLEDVGPRTQEYIPSWVEAPEVTHNQVTGVVITVDTFGNLITNIPQHLVTALGAPQVHIGGHVLPFRRTYGDVRPGDYLALINSYGMLEVARSEQSASDGLGVQRGAPVTVRAI